MKRTIGRMTIAMLVVTCVAPFIAYYLANGVATSSLESQLQRSLVLTNWAIATEIERFRYLPIVVGEDARIRALAGSERNAAALADANIYLETIVRQARPAELCVLDEHGRTLAASNHATPESFVGHDYSFRPFFRNAMRDGDGRYYAIGVTTAIADRWGIVFLSGNPDWKYRPLVPLGDEGASRLPAERTYEGPTSRRRNRSFLPAPACPPSGRLTLRQITGRSRGLG